MTKVTKKAVAKSTLSSKISGSASKVPPHVIVIARAGTGKTTTLIEGMKVLRGMKPDIKPSPQQQAIWDELSKSNGAYSVGFAAFGRAIADDIQERIKGVPGCEAMTLHQMGSRIVRKAFPSAKMDTDGKKTIEILEDYYGQDIFELRKLDPELIHAIIELTSKAKMALTENSDELQELIDHFTIEISDKKRSELVSTSLEILKRSKDLERYPVYNFDDMIWLPVILGLPVYKFDVLMVDEAQDLNRCQQELSLRAGKRLILVGDPKQAIFGFAGADAKSLPRMQGLLESQPNGCKIYPLNVTRRCGKKIVEEAQSIVPDFYALDDAHDGEVRYVQWSSPQEDSYRKEVEDGDMVLCRVNGPLVSQCFKFIKEGKKAQIIGRDIGQGLIYLIKKLMKTVQLEYQELIRHPKMTSPDSLTELSTALDGWYDLEVAKELRKKVPSEGKILAVGDKKDCIDCFINSDAKNAADVVIKINQIFTDRTKDGIRMSSIHRAKGLEAHRVFFLRNEDCPCPHPNAKSAWEVEQERNLVYVAVTRAINELIYVV